jgi:hypothetical protein
MRISPMPRNLILQERITDQRQEKLILGNLISMLLLPLLERQECRSHIVLTKRTKANRAALVGGT